MLPAMFGSGSFRQHQTANNQRSDANCRVATAIVAPNVRIAASTMALSPIFDVVDKVR